MATAGDRNARQMERLATCSICLEKFRSPKVLPCMHTFCLAPCLTNLIDPRARSFRCPECRREHTIPPGGVQSFPSNLTMIGFLDLQPSASLTRTDRCSICKQQKQTLVECRDCSQFICTTCREPHLREALYNINASVSQLRRSFPKLNEKIGTYEQRVNAVRMNDDQIRREISSAIAALIDQLKHREATLLTDVEVHLQSQLRMFRLQQETAEVELASVASFCESAGAALTSGRSINDTDVANMRLQCTRYNKQLDALQAQIPNDVQKLRLVFDNQAALTSAIQNLGRVMEPSQGHPSHVSANQVYQLQQHTPRLSSEAYPQTATSYATSQSRMPVYGTPLDRHMETIYYSNNASGPPPLSLSQTIGYRPTPNRHPTYGNNSVIDPSFTVPSRPPNPSYTPSWDTQASRRSVSNVQTTSVFGPNPFAANNPRSHQPQPPPEQSPRRNYVTSTTAARSLEGDDRPIFGGRGNGGDAATRFGRGRGRGGSLLSTQNLAPIDLSLQRSGTFVLDEPSVQNLPQSGAQRPRDPVIVQELYNVRRRNRARTPVAFTVNLSEAAQPSDAEAVG